MIKIFEMFSGYGGASFALRKVNIEFECVGYSEIDKYAIQIYNNNHPNIKNYGDCKLINPSDIHDFDLLTGGFPCQAFSNAGKQLGEADARGTLFYEIIRIAEVKQPKYMLLENVKGLTAQKFKTTFDKILSELDRIGYNVQWKVLNSKEYGIPQSRNRVWFVCFRKDIEASRFKWPEKQELKMFVKDLLEENVNEKYNLSDKQIKRIMESDDVKKKFSALNPDIAISQTARQFENWKGNFIEDPKSKQLYNETEPIPCLRSGIGSGNKLNYIQWDMSGKGYKSQQDRPYPADGIMNTIPNHNTKSKVNIFALRTRENGKQAEINDTQMSKHLTSVQTDNLVMNTVSISSGLAAGSNENLSQVKRTEESSFHFRRLTPKECFRLMGFVNDEIKLDGLSDTQIYKLAGNGWEINIASKIFKNILR
jgi:DNA (cytosine-5)-methyltransferase 1